MLESNPSASSRILDYLKTLDPAAEFTSTMLEEQLDVTNGSVSGYLAKLKSAGHVRVVGREGRSSVYKLVDLSSATARGWSSTGSRPGRTHSGTTSAAKCAALLRQIADEVESHKTGLESYSTEELLREVMKRQRRVEVKS